MKIEKTRAKKPILGLKVKSISKNTLQPLQL